MRSTAVASYGGAFFYEWFDCCTPQLDRIWRPEGHGRDMRANRVVAERDVDADDVGVALREPGNEKTGAVRAQGTHGPGLVLNLRDRLPRLEVPVIC
jgi:hypothetical protein